MGSSRYIFHIKNGTSGFPGFPPLPRQHEGGDTHGQQGEVHEQRPVDQHGQASSPKNQGVYSKANTHVFGVAPLRTHQCAFFRVTSPNKTNQCGFPFGILSGFPLKTLQKRVYTPCILLQSSAITSIEKKAQGDTLLRYCAFAGAYGTLKPGTQTMAARFALKLPNQWIPRKKEL